MTATAMGSRLRADYLSAKLSVHSGKLKANSPFVVLNHRVTQHVASPIMRSNSSPVKIPSAKATTSSTLDSLDIGKEEYMMLPLSFGLRFIVFNI